MQLRTGLYTLELTKAFVDFMVNVLSRCLRVSTHLTLLVYCTCQPVVTHAGHQGS